MLAQRIQMVGRPIITDGLVGRWLCGAKDVNDYSPSGYNGTAYGSPTWEDGPGGPGLVLNGSSQYVVIGNQSGLEFYSNWTFSLLAWIKNSTTASRNILSKQQNSGSYIGYGLGTAADGKYNVFLYNGSYGGRIRDFPSAYSDGMYHHICFTYNNDAWAGYVDGAEVTLTIINNYDPFSIVSTADFQIGGRGGANNLPTASIFDARAYNRTLTAAEVAQIARRQG